VHDGIAEVCFRNTDTERDVAYTARGLLALERAKVWALDNGCGVLDVRSYTG
jgi:hypothetical protein